MKEKTKTRGGMMRRLLPAAAAILVLAAMLPGCRTASAPTGPDVSETEPTLPMTAVEEPIDLGQGMRILRMDRYSGMYMEDGTNEIVRDVMMLIVENTAEQDLQLARIDVDYGDFTAEFEVTNLPAGERVVLLERSRRVAGAEDYLSITVSNPVFFPEPMDLQEERIGLQGEAGVVRVENRTDADIPGPVCIYYKNCAEDIFYGGITYRVTIAEGISAGQTVMIPAGHYAPENCRFVMVTCGG